MGFFDGFSSLPKADSAASQKRDDKADSWLGQAVFSKGNDRVVPLVSDRQWQSVADLLEEMAAVQRLSQPRTCCVRVGGAIHLTCSRVWQNQGWPMSSPPSPRYRPDIDGLRAVAVMLVVNFHAFPEAMPGGFIGVDIFFMISGFLITGIIVRELEQQRFSLLGFYVRRLRRIFPALIVMLIHI